MVTGATHKVTYVYSDHTNFLKKMCGEWFVYHCNTWVPFIKRDGDVIQEI